MSTRRLHVRRRHSRLRELGHRQADAKTARHRSPTFVKSPVAIGIGDDFVAQRTQDEPRATTTPCSTRHFPGEREETSTQSSARSSKVMGYMDVLYGIDNPLFLDSTTDPEPVFKTLLPWLMKYSKNIRKAMDLKAPINDYLAKFTMNPRPHRHHQPAFLPETPAFFALSYFSLYLDRQPSDGRYRVANPRHGSLSPAPKASRNPHEDDGGRNRSRDPDRQDRRPATSSNIEELVWTADMNAMYQSVKPQRRTPPIQKRLKELEGKTGGDSVFTVYLEADVEPAVMSRTCGAHSFYTPASAGLGNITADRIDPGGCGRFRTARLGSPTISPIRPTRFRSPVCGMPPLPPPARPD
ncbi:MAG: hypothetical protein M0C28_18340 [Candidatus Moduliflexus flocculans]|nr:hypothetical protein [Candidatus Moduliflexus flocculans]